MELLKVFVGDGTNSSLTATTANMLKGDLLLLKASDYTPWVSANGNVPVVIAGKNDKGVYYSAPITNANVVYCNYKETDSLTEASATVLVPASATMSLTASTTYSIGVQIKEDLRMGTYNKNTEIIASYTTPSTITGVTDGALKTEMASTLAKGFAANPLTSAGSPYQLVNVSRQSPGTAFTGATAAGQNLVVTTGSRAVTYASGSLTGGLVAGVVLNLGTSWYLVEKVDAINRIITLDTAFQGTSGTITSGNTAALAYFTTTPPTTFTFEFDAVAQTQKNRYDQFRMVDFIVIVPKGNDAGLITVTPTAQVYPSGTYRQVRDLEEKAYTNSMPLINYREFPFEDFALNANPSVNNYNILAITYNLPAGYNYMQSSSKEFPQTVVVCSPNTGVAIDQFDQSTTNTFLNKFDAWFTGTIAGDALPDWTP